MKKLLCILITIAFVLSSVTAAEAKNDHSKDKGHHGCFQQPTTCEETQKEFKIHESTVIKYGKYKLPINPIEKGMGASVSYNKHKAVITVTKGTITIVINLKRKTVCVNGSYDKNSGIYKAKNSQKMNVLIRYIAGKLGYGVKISGDIITVITDNAAPTLSSISSAVYKPSENKLIINVTGAGADGDIVDVTKLSFIDYTLGKTYQLTSTPGTGSSGKVTNFTTLTITIGSSDKLGLAGFVSATFYLNIAAGSLLKDTEGNTSPGFSFPQLIPVNTSGVIAGLDAPSNVTLASEGTVEVANTLNSTSIYLSAVAKITPGQATGGKAELYVGSRLVATDIMIGSADNNVSFTTTDGSPTNAELQAAVPTGGVVTVKLYNSNGNSVISTVSNPTLIVDYIAPTLGSVSYAIYDMANNQLSIQAYGAGAYGDIVDVTKLSLFDIALGKNYQLTNNPVNGSSGSVNSASSLIVYFGSTDRNGLAGFGTSTVYLTIAAGSLLKDNAGNTSPSLPSIQFLQVTIVNSITLLNAPTNVTITPVGTAVVANTLNCTTLNMDASAKITAGQATGGKAELYVGSRLIATDAYIAATDTNVTFTTSDKSPTNAELQAAVPFGGVVTVKLYRPNNISAVSTVSNPTLIVDYVAPTLKIDLIDASAIYDSVNGKIYLYVEGAGAIGDMVDVTKIVLFDSATGKIYQLTNLAGTGSSGTVNSANLLIINIGSQDKAGIYGFGGSTIILSIYPGSLLKDTAGNTSPYLLYYPNLTVTVNK